MSADADLEQVGSVTFQVAPGNAGAISDAAIWHEQISAQMSTHAQSITDATSTALSRWQGDAAASYQALSGRMTDAFRAGEIRAGETAQTMRSVAGELDRCQQEGTRALTQANDWLQKATQYYQHASDLKTKLDTATSHLSNLEGQMQTGIQISAHAGPSPTTGPLPGEIQAPRRRTSRRSRLS